MFFCHFYFQKYWHFGWNWGKKLKGMLVGFYFLVPTWFLVLGYLQIFAASPAIQKLASVTNICCFPKKSCFNANLQAPLSVLFTDSDVSWTWIVVLIGFSNIKTRLSISISTSLIFFVIFQDFHVALPDFFFWETHFAVVVFHFVSLCRFLFRWDGPTNKFDFFDSKRTLFFGEFHSGFSSGLNDSSNFSGEIRSIVGCKSDIAYVFSVLVDVDNWVQVLTHESWEGRNRSAEASRNSSDDKNFAGKNEGKHFQWRLFRHLRTKVCKGHSYLQKVLLPAWCCAASDKVLNGWFF